MSDLGKLREQVEELWDAADDEGALMAYGSVLDLIDSFSKEGSMERVVSYLRGLAESEQVTQSNAFGSDWLRTAADDIERGEHLKNA